MCKIYVKVQRRLLLGHLEPHNRAFGNLGKLFIRNNVHKDACATFCIKSSLREIDNNMAGRKIALFFS